MSNSLITSSVSVLSSSSQEITPLEKFRVEYALAIMGFKHFVRLPFRNELDVLVPRCVGLSLLVYKEKHNKLGRELIMQYSYEEIKSVSNFESYLSAVRSCL
ncbi:hypothetical protein AVEN_165663-1 [Araneus ventricosus]|uniref:Uncharacterized protein n=1 Tax=Araneus ventricosus TaxID=182803 RepID=A0A4Y1ZWC6_ARAVE|nr:hypothetical protein AVEN_165663-1 [Araneus ventricosus]